MLILSVHAAAHDSAAALFDDYELLAAVQQERMTRRKGDGGIPLAAIAEVLEIAGIEPGQVEALVLTRAHYPVRFFRHFGAYKRIEGFLNRSFGREHAKDVALEMARMDVGDARTLFDGPRFLAYLGLRRNIPVFFTNHHFAHGLSALFYTDWDDALIYTADGCGDNVHYSHRVLRNEKLTCLFGDDRWLTRKRRVDSLGLAYGFTTQALGYRMNRHEGKLTGLAAFGQPVLAAEIGRHFTVDESGLIDSDFASDRAMRTELHALAEGREPADVAASIQAVLEERVLASVQRLLREHRVRHLALAGGVLSNVRLNRLLCEGTDVEEIFIFPGMGDEGLVVGGALEFLLERDGLPLWLKRRRRLSDVYWGRSHDDVIDSVLAGDARVAKLFGDPIETTTTLLGQGDAGAIYDGRMEFGPRALGARSILASPADAEINRRMNARLQRTEFMPFAPYVLTEDADSVFGITSANFYAARFMTITTSVNERWRSRIPAVVHVDGTARPQIVVEGRTPLYAGILRAFKRATGLPVLVNTSFNAHEEPIINRPDECLRALLGDRIDFVVTRRGVYRRR
jgi:carbamoyltransferase